MRTRAGIFFPGVTGPVKFAKPALDLPALLAKLRARGLQVPNPASALQHLRLIGYYRLTAYALHFRQPGVPGKPFQPGTTFEDVLGLYTFDRELRLLVIDAIERIEVTVRGSLVNVMSVRYNDSP